MNPWIQNIVFELIGVPLALIRLYEPYVWQTMKLELNKIKKGKKIKKTKTKFAKESLCSFLNSTCNIEFVYLILLGINNFMDHIKIE
jgi:hypothetical protein